MLDGRSVQTVSTPFNIFKNKENIEAMLNESLNQFKFDSTHFQQAFNIFLRFQPCWTICAKRPQYLAQKSIERRLKQVLKPFKRAFSWCKR